MDKMIHSIKWVQLPISDEVIDKVNKMATKEKQPLFPKMTPIFEWSPGFVINDQINLDEG